MGDLGQPVEDVARPEPDDQRFWSVTTLIGVLDKKAIPYWAAGETATAAINDQDVWQAMLKRDRNEAWKWLRDARYRRNPGQLGAAELGTVVHACCEQYALTGRRPSRQEIELKVRHEYDEMTADAIAAEAEQVDRFLDQFDKWLDQWQPEYTATEVVVYSERYGYAGTADAFMTIDGMRVVADYKTSRQSFDKRGNQRGPYPEVALQLAGYRWAEMAAVWRPRRTEVQKRRYYLLSETEKAQAVPVPEVDGGICIHITPEHATSHAVRCDERVFESFLYVMECARWQFEMSKDVIGAPMVPPVSEWPRLAAG